MTSIPGKVTVCGFQESGVEWLSHIIRHITNIQGAHKVYHQSVNVSSYVNLGPSSCPVDVFLPNNKVVLIIRQPKDTAVATFIQGGYHDAWDFGDFLAQFFGENSSLGLSWTGYISKWNGAIQQLGPGRVHIIYYNNLVNNLRDEMQKLHTYLEITPEQSIEQLISACNYHNFFDKREPDRKRRKVVQTRENVEFELHEVDLWKKYFTVKQNEDVNQALSKYQDTNTSMITLCK